MVSFPGNNHKHTGRVHAKGQDDESHGTAVRYGTLRRRTAGWQACNSNRELAPLGGHRKDSSQMVEEGSQRLPLFLLSPLCLPPPMAWYCTYRMRE